MRAVYDCGKVHTTTFLSENFRRNTHGDSNAPITESQECLCGAGTEQRPDLPWAEDKMLKS